MLFSFLIIVYYFVNVLSPKEFANEDNEFMQYHF